MRTFLGTLISALLVLQLGCNDKSVTPPTGGAAPGTLQLQFSDSPAGIVQVVARLTRAGYEDRVLSLSISDSGGGASGTVNDIAAGRWHLRVDAIDDQGHIKYTGETDVEVIGGEATQVSLQLNPTSGSLEIIVTWGQTCTPAPSGLISWWPADNLANDVVGTNHGIPSNGAAYASGKVSLAFNFDGLDDFIRIPSAPSLNPTGSFTIDAWVYPMQDGRGTLISKWGDLYEWVDQRSYIIEMIPGGNVSFGISDSAHQNDPDFHILYTSGGVLNFLAWNHIAGVYDRSTGTRMIYVNGVKVAERTDAPIAITQSIADLTFGAAERASGYFYPTQFRGRIDEVDLFGRALAPSEIMHIYQAGNSGKCR